MAFYLQIEFTPYCTPYYCLPVPPSIDRPESNMALRKREPDEDFDGSDLFVITGFHKGLLLGFLLGYFYAKYQLGLFS